MHAMSWLKFPAKREKKHNHQLKKRANRLICSLVFYGELLGVFGVGKGFAIGGKGGGNGVVLYLAYPFGAFWEREALYLYVIANHFPGDVGKDMLCGRERGNTLNYVTHILK